MIDRADVGLLFNCVRVAGLSIRVLSNEREVALDFCIVMKSYSEGVLCELFTLRHSSGLICFLIVRARLF